METIYRFSNFNQAEWATFLWDNQVHAVHLTIAAASMALLGSMSVSRSYWRLRQIFKQPLSITDSIQKYKAIHVNGRLSVDPNSTSIDSMLGMKSPVQGSLGLYRKVEILSKQNNWLQSRHPYNYLEQSRDVNDSLPYGSYVTHKIESKLFINPSIRLQNLKVDDYVIASMLQKDSDATRLPIDKNLIESTFLKLKENPHKTDSRADLQAMHEAIRIYNEHPFSESMEILPSQSSSSSTKKKMVVDYDSHYMYLRRTSGQEEAGDIRISFYDFGVLTDVTIMGRNNGDCIDQYYREYIKLSQAGSIEVERNGKIVKVNADAISFIVKGILDKNQMVKHVMKSIKSGPSFVRTFMCMVVIIALYAYLDNQMFYSVHEENEVYKRTVRKNPETNEIEINHKSKKQYQARNILSAPLHLGALVGFSYALLPIGFACTLAVLYNNYRFYSDHLQVLKTINGEMKYVKSQSQNKEESDIQIVPDIRSFNSILKQHLLLE